MKRIRTALLVSLALGNSHVLQAEAGSVPMPDGGSIGINGAACQYNTVASAIQNASAGDTILILPSTRIEFIGKIDIDLTFVPAEAAAPTFSGCEQEMASAVSNTVVFDANGSSHDATGGLAEIRNGADVTFRHMWLRNATASNGGVLAVTGGSTLTLDDALVTDGVASGSGGDIHVSATPGEPSLLELINDSSVYRGTATTGDGGAIALFNSDLVIVDGNVGVSSNNGFSTAGNDGGGIYANNSTISMSTSQSRILWNQAGHYGGGLYAVDSTLDVSASLINNNSATLSGGGMYLDNSDLVMSGATLDSNSATTSATNQGGGAIYLISSSTAQISNTDLTRNSSANGGGALNARSGTLLELLAGTTITGNSAGNGGGILVSSATVVDDSIISNNSGGSRGGGIFCFACPSLTLSGGTLLEVNDANSGGGVDVFGISATVVDVSGTTFRLNQATSQSDGQGIGGGLRQVNGTLDVSNSVFDQNSAAQNGGGLHASRFGSASLVGVTLDNVAFTANQTTNSITNQGGGGAFIDNADSVVIVDSLLDLNDSDNLGGGAYLVDNDLARISGTQFNQNSGSLGAGLYSIRNNLIVDQQSIFSGNVATGSGGGLYAFSGTASLRDVEFLGNSSNRGGGLYVFLVPDFDAQDIRVINNNAEADGGGISFRDSNGTIFGDPGQSATQCDPFSLPANRYCAEFSGNTAGGFGGGIHLADLSTGTPSIVTVEKVAIVGNQAVMGGSAAYFEAGSGSMFGLHTALVANNGNATDESTVIEALGEHELTFDAITVAGNLGSPLWVDDILTGVDLNRSILYSNSIGPRVAFGVPFTRGCNNSQAVDGGSQSMGGSLGNPAFTSTARGDYRLPSFSASVDRCSTGPDRDLDGLFRPNDGGSHDQGAFELEGRLTLPDPVFQDGFEDS